MKKYLKALVPGIAGLLVAGALVIPAVWVGSLDRKMSNAIVYAMYCDFQRSDQTSQMISERCVLEKTKLDQYRKKSDTYEVAENVLSVGSIIIALISLAYIVLRLVFFMVVRYQAPLKRILPLSRKLRAEFAVDRTARKIENYKKLRELDILSQSQYEAKIEELRKKLKDIPS